MLISRALTCLIAAAWVAIALPQIPGNLPNIQAQASSHQHQTIYVHTAAQLLKAIGSHRTLVLRPNTYNLSGLAVPANHPHLERDKDTGGLIIKNVTHLTLRGEDVRATKIVISELAPHVLQFSNSRRIHLESLEIGHVPQSHAICLGAVLGFHSSQNIVLRDLNLFGSGTFGLWLEDTHQLRLEDSVIKECSQGIAFLSDSRQVQLRNSLFVDNAGGLNLWGRSQMRVTGSRFIHNHPLKSKDYSKSLLSVKGPGRLQISHSQLTDNVAESLKGEGASQIRLFSNYMIRNHYSR